MAEKKKPAKKEAKGQSSPVTHIKVDFPSEFPTDSIMHLAGMIRGTETFSKGEALQHAGIILGCSGKLLGPSPVGAASAKGPKEDFSSLSDEDLANRLSEAAAPKGDEAGAEFIPPWMVPIVMEVLRRIFGF